MIIRPYETRDNEVRGFDDYCGTVGDGAGA